MTCSLNSPFFSQSTGSGVLVAGGCVLLFEIQSYMHRLQPSRGRSENNQAKTIIIYFLFHHSLNSPNNVGNQGQCSGSALASHLWGLLIPGFEGYSQSLSVFLPPQTDDVPCLWSLSLERMFRGIDNIWRFICWWWPCISYYSLEGGISSLTLPLFPLMNSLRAEKLCFCTSSTLGMNLAIRM